MLLRAALCILSIGAAGSLSACSGPTPTEPSPKTVRTSILSAEAQEALTPYEVLELLKRGNARFTSADLTQRDHSTLVRKAVDGQYPKAIVLSCVDSRVPVEDVFDCAIGDIFVARVAGNFVNADILGSMEFACAAAGSKLVLVMGHEHCGAVKSAIDGVEIGNITSMLDNIEPAIDNAKPGFVGRRVSSNPAWVQKVCEANVRNTIARIRSESSVLAGLESEGKILIRGAVYDMNSGTVSFLD